MKGGIGIPHIRWYGEEGGFNVLVIDLLGPDMQHLLKQYTKFSNGTAVSIAEQMVSFHLKSHSIDFKNRILSQQELPSPRHQAGKLCYRNRRSHEHYFLD